MALAGCAATPTEFGGTTVVPVTPSAACELSPADRVWLDEAMVAWDHALASVVETDHPDSIQTVIFDAKCQLTSRTAMTGGEKVWTAQAHGGEVILPDGNRLPAQVVSFAAPAPGGSFFVMAAPSIWRVAGVRSTELGLEQLMTAVMLHEAVHVLQFPTHGSRITRLVNAHTLPDGFSDDSIQERFEADAEFAASITHETELLLAAAAAGERADAVRLATEARSLAQARHQRWFTGELDYLREAEDVWLTMEGSGQWLGYQWLIAPIGGSLAPSVAAQGFGLRGRSWSQRQGFALFAALDRLTSTEWKRRLFGDGGQTAGELLDEALIRAPR